MSTTRRSADDGWQPRGPLGGVRVIEVAGLGAGPFCAMVLADMGADVVRVDRASEVGSTIRAILGRGKRSVAVDLKTGTGMELLLRMVERADVLVEAFRPGVAERLGFGPERCLDRNRRLVFARATGWGQDGPLHTSAGHDINYIALSGVLSLIGRAEEPPVPPLNLVGDFGGGGMVLAFGIVCALLEAQRSGLGQVVDGSMVDGSALLSTMYYELLGTGSWIEERGRNALDGGAPYYDSYRTADGQWVAIGAVEGQFFAQLIEKLGLEEEGLPSQSDTQSWPDLRQRIAEAVARRTREEWDDIFRGTDGCLTPVLHPSEAWQHPQHRARRTFVDVGGIRQPAPAPRLSRTPGRVRGTGPRAGEHVVEVLSDWGFDTAEIDAYVNGAAMTPGTGS